MTAGTKMISRTASLGILVSACIAACGAATAPPSLEEVTRDPSSDIYADAAVKALRPVLALSGKAGRIDYSSDCPTRPGGFQTTPFPRTHIGKAPPGATGLAAIRAIFRDDSNVAVSENPPGIIRIAIGAVPRELLRIRISHIRFSSDERYNPPMALDAIVGNAQVQSAMRRLGITPVNGVYDYLMTPALPGLPHLPRAMRNIPVEAALERVARSFKGIVLYGVCTRSPQFALDFVSPDTNPGSHATVSPGRRDPSPPPAGRSSR